MRSSSGKDYSVYDFNEEDEVVESSSRGFMEKFRNSQNPNPRKSAITKYTFLQTFAKGNEVQQKEVNNVVCIDFDASDGDQKCRAFGTSGRDFTVQEEVFEVDDIVVSTSRNREQHGHLNEDYFKTRDLISKCFRGDSSEVGSLGVPSMHTKQLNCSFMELASDGKLVDVVSDDGESLKESSQSISDDDESLKESSQSTSVSDPTEHEVSGSLECTAIDYCNDGDRDMEKKVNTEVVVSPDFVFYGDTVSTRSQLTFSSDFIKLEVFSACESTVSFRFEWAIDDIVYIECRRSDNVDIAYVKLRLRSIAVKGVENLNGTSVISKLMLAVSDPKWQEKERMITSLGASYKSIWNPILNAEMADEDDDFMGQNIMFILKRYSSNFDEPFEDVVYPKGDPDAVCISKRDVELLQPATFINDTIIDFYIKYLKNMIQMKDKHRFHFFNSFFFRKLADLDKDPGSALEGRAAFLRVRKWTRKVNIFEKDYIFIPINFNLHWSLIVVCHPGEILSFTDEDIRRASKVPCILHMDSIKGSHRGLKNLFQSYLLEEWKERHEESSIDVLVKFSNLRFIPLELPQQENSFDCGLFLLHYVELFLEEAPVNFNPFKITKFSDFISPNWFPSAEASHKRSAIHRLILEIIDDQSLKAVPASCSNPNHSKFPESDSNKEETVEFISEQHSPTKKSCPSNLLSTIFDKGVMMELSALSSPVGVQYGKEMDTVSSEFFEHGKVTRSYPDEQYPRFDQIATFEKLHCPLSTVEEDVETNEQFVYSTSGRACYRLAEGITTETCTTSYSSKDVGAFEMVSQEILTRPKEHRDGDSSSMCSSCESTNSSEIGVNESRYFVSSNKQVATEAPRPASPENCRDGLDSPSLTSSKSPEKCVVEDLPKRNSDVEAMAESKESGESFFSCPENFLSSSYQDVESGKNCDTSDDDVYVISDSLGPRSKQQSHKRMKFVPPRGEQRHTRSMAKAQHL